MALGFSHKRETLHRIHTVPASRRSVASSSPPHSPVCKQAKTAVIVTVLLPGNGFSVWACGTGQGSNFFVAANVANGP